MIELSKMLAYFSTSLGQWEVPGTSGNFFENFPKCWQVGNFLNSVWKFKVFGVLETAVKPSNKVVNNIHQIFNTEY